MIKAFVRNIAPPILIKIYFFFRFPRIKYGGVFKNWDKAKKNSKGYEHREIIKKIIDSSRLVRDGKAYYERDSILFYEKKYSWPILAGILSASNLDNYKIRVLDFGGALGSKYFQHRDYMELFDDIIWAVIEQEEINKIGKEEFQTNVLRFYATIKDCISDFIPNTILFGSVLQYLENPYHVLNQASKIDHKILIIERTPFINDCEDIITIQNIPKWIYKSSYPMHVFSMKKFINYIRGKWEIIAEINTEEGECFIDARVKFDYKSMLLRKI